MRPSRDIDPRPPETGPDGHPCSAARVETPPGPAALSCLIRALARQAARETFAATLSHQDFATPMPDLGEVDGHDR